MNWKPTLRGILAALAMVPLAAQAQPSGSAQNRFDYYLLSLSIAPSFCALSPANRGKPDCRNLNDAEFQQTPLTVHGLWPNRARVSVNLQPKDCPGPPLVLSDSVRAELRRYMPGGPGLQKHEWTKHGTCSGLPPEVYFTAIVSLARQANEVIGAAMRDGSTVISEVRVADLVAAVAAKDRAMAAAIVVDCRQPTGGGATLVEEIRLTLSKDLKPIPVGKVGLGQNSGCPRGVGRIPPVPR